MSHHNGGTNLMCMDERDRCMLSSEDDRLDFVWLEGPGDLKNEKIPAKQLT
jgi:hypothetical protein